MKHQREIVIGLSLILIVIKVTTVGLPVVDQQTYIKTSSNNSITNLTAQIKDLRYVKEEDHIWYLGAITSGIICLIVGGVMMYTSKKESINSFIILVLTGILCLFIWYFVLKHYWKMRKGAQRYPSKQCY
jgi:hypothetical protein